MKPKSMRVPLKALWPPITLIAADIALMVPLYWLGFDLLFAGLAIGLAILVFDMRGRRMDYRNALYHIRLGRDPSRVAKSYQFSWCGRVACQHAAWAVGNETGAAVAGYYHENGYRWFHIFPDNTFSPKSPFLSLRFWEITLKGNSRARFRLEQMALEDRRATPSPQDESQASASIRQAA